MRAGELDRVVTLQKRSEQRDAMNAKVAVYGDLATVRASKTDVSDAERVRAQQVGADHTTRFRIRWSPTVAVIGALDRLTCEGRLYEITGVKELGRREALEITANCGG